MSLACRISTPATFLSIVLAVVGCAQPEPSTGRPTVAEARTFVDDAEQRLLDLWIRAERAAWVQSNFITDDTELIAAEARREVIGATMELAAAATRFDGVELSFDLQRKLDRIAAEALSDEP